MPQNMMVLYKHGRYRIKQGTHCIYTYTICRIYISPLQCCHHQVHENVPGNLYSELTVIEVIALLMIYSFTMDTLTQHEC